MATPVRRGRDRRVPGEKTVRVNVYLSETERERLRLLAEINRTTISELLRDAGNEAAEECGAPTPFADRRTAERRQAQQDVAVNRRGNQRRA